MILKNHPNDMKLFNEKFTGIYRGVVEDNNPVDENGRHYKDGRVRVRVFGLHTPNKASSETDGIPTEHLPLAEPVLSLWEGSVSGHGCWTVPLQGSHVMCFFENGNINQLKYFGTIPGIPISTPNKNMGFNDPDGVFPESDRINEPDFNRLAREETVDTPIAHRAGTLISGIYQANTESWDEPSPSYGTEYPHSIVLNTHAGMLIEIDSTPDNERYHIFHPSNTFIEIDPSGNIIIKNTSNKYEIVCGNKHSQLSANYHKTINGDETVKVFGEKIDEINNNITITIGNNRDESVESNYVLNVGGLCNINVGSDCKISSDSSVTVVSPSINVSGLNECVIASNTGVSIQAPTININEGGSSTESTETVTTRTPAGSPVYCSDIFYTEVDYGNIDDEPDVDDGLNIYPPTDNPTAEDIARSEELDVSPTETKEEDEVEPLYSETLSASCGDISSPVNPSLQLSSNFTVAQMTTDTALSNYSLKAQAGYEDYEIACNLRALCENILEKVVSKYGRSSFVITSGFRHGTGKSQHERGQAVDIQFPMKSNSSVYDIAVWIKDNLNYDQLILEYGGNRPWIHISYNPDGNRSTSHGAKFGTRISAGNYQWRVLKNMA
jgi:hypothetical protein